MPLYIVECIKIEKGIQGRPTPNRKMVGPFADEDEALNAVEDLGKEFDNTIAHTLHAPEGVTVKVNWEQQ